MRPFLPFAAVLTAAFLLGCQDPGSEPVGPESVGPQFAEGGVPQFAKKNCKDTNHPPPCGGGEEPPPPITFTATFSGDDVSGVVELQENFQSSVHSPVTLILSFLKEAPDDGGYTGAQGSTCFGGDVFSGGVAITVRSNNLTNAELRMNFDAKGTDGRTVNYGLGLFGTMASWPPTTGNDITITGGTFEVNHSGGPGKNVACIGEGTLAFTAVVKRTL